VFQCPAKINLALAVGAPRDDGFHPICSWMAKVSLMDEIVLTPRTAASRFEIEWAEDAPSPSAIDWPVEKDLAFRAHAMMQDAASRELPVEAIVRKRIPVGAGLGGGSSDAAGMMLALRSVFELPISDEQLRSIAAELGSDVAFFLNGPSAVAMGRGEICRSVELPGRLDLVLILPPLHCNTAAVYRKFDALNPDAVLNDSHVQAQALCGATMVMDDELFNDLADAAEAVEPRLAQVRGLCQAAAGRRVHVTGSGAAMFALCRDATEAMAVAEAIRRAVEIPAVAVETMGGKESVPR
jgi:4-diphosphocytidyl-2-C-methyl-D-erythritol kinase